MKQEADHHLEVLLTRDQIQARVTQLAEEITRDYSGAGELVLVAVLRGSVYFAVDLSRRLNLPFILDFIGISSYAGASPSRGIVRITKDLESNIVHKNVLLLEDIVDTGLTLNYLIQNLKTRNPSSLRVCAFLDMPARRIVNIPVDYYGFSLPDLYVVGYGLDYHERYRNLEVVAALKDPK
ncbi:MAG: hypoxanthine phosphoribosyltransferase [Bacillota bacterium]